MRILYFINFIVQRILLLPLELRITVIFGLLLAMTLPFLRVGLITPPEGSLTVMTWFVCEKNASVVFAYFVRLLRFSLTLALRSESSLELASS